MAQWALFVGALVYAFDRDGSRATGLASIALLVPIALVAPTAGKSAHLRRPDRVRLWAYATQALGVGGAAVAAFVDAPVAVVVAGCAVTTAAFTFLPPACAVLLPSLVRSARELTVANVWIGSCESVSMLGGSLLAALLLGVHGPALVLAACATLNLFSTLLTGLDRGIRAAAPIARPDDDDVGAVRMVVRSIIGLRDRPGATGVLAVAGGQYVLVGALDLIMVVLAIDRLGLGDSGPGLLSTSVGIGALLCAVTSTLLVRRDRLAPLLVGALGCVVVAALVLGVVPTVATALMLLPVAGFSRSLLDLTSRMLLQRATPPQSLAAVFGAIELFSGLGMLLGSVVSQVLIAVSGVEAALIGLSALFALLLVVTFRSLRIADDGADIPLVAISLLRRIPAFAVLPPLEMETVARAATEIAVEAGEVVMKEGELGDRYYAVADGEFEVSIDGKYVRTAGRGSGFGEIALLANVPRTATITARRDGSLLAIRRAPFLTAVTGSDASRHAAVGMIRAVGVDLDIAVDQ